MRARLPCALIAEGGSSGPLCQSWGRGIPWPHKCEAILRIQWPLPWDMSSRFLLPGGGRRAGIALPLQCADATSCLDSLSATGLPGRGLWPRGGGGASDARSSLPASRNGPGADGPCLHAVFLKARRLSAKHAGGGGGALSPPSK